MNDDLGSLFEKFNINKDSISPEMINNLKNMLNNNSGASNNTENTNNIDFETIMKMKSIIDKMNTKDNPNSKLLLSLKPYLKESRRSKIDQYIQLMNMSQMMDGFGFLGGDNKNARK